MSQHAIGVDLGGTNLRWGVIDSSGQKVLHDQIQRPKQPEEIVAAIRMGIDACLEKYPEAVGAGIAVPGVVRDGRITSINLGWLDFDLDEHLGNLATKVSVLNDMAAGALGELHFGRARGM